MNTLEQFQRLRQSGLSQNTCFLSATTLWNLSLKDARKQHKILMRRYALEATSLDILGELMLKYRQHDHLLESMSRELKRENLPASFFNVYRHTINDSRASLLALAQHRKESGRDRCFTPEQKREEKERRKAILAEQFKCHELGRLSGDFIHSGYNMLQAGADLLAPDLAVRDILRMRMLPKSPREDWLLAKMFDCLAEQEKTLDPDDLSDEEVQTDLHSWQPTNHAIPGSSRSRDYDHLAKTIFLERLKAYNEVWQKAEEKVEGRMKELGLKPRICKPFIGVPDLIKRAATGEEAAVNELTGILRHNAELQRQSAENYQPDTPYKPEEIWYEERAQSFAIKEQESSNLLKKEQSVAGVTMYSSCPLQTVWDTAHSAEGSGVPLTGCGEPTLDSAPNPTPLSSPDSTAGDKVLDPVSTHSENPKTAQPKINHPQTPPAARDLTPDFGLPTRIILALLLAFTLAWTTATQRLAPLFTPPLTSNLIVHQASATTGMTNQATPAEWQCTPIQHRSNPSLFSMVSSTFSNTS